VNAVGAQIAQSQARLGLLRRQAERARTLLQRGAGTAQLSEAAEAAVREAGEAARALTAQLDQARATLEAARLARVHADLTAPFTGLLTEVLPNIGETVAPPAPVFTLIDDRRLHVDATIDEADAAKVRPGQEAELKLDALPDQIVPGRVARVDPAVKRDLKGARTLGVEVEVLSVDQARRLGLKPGMSANVDIVVAERRDVLYLPTAAVVGRGVNRAVYVLAPEGRYHRARKRTVQIGVSNWDRTEILSGVGPDERVAATLNVKGLDDGVLVQIEKGGR
jgi:HlyD family secretion protein